MNSTPDQPRQPTSTELTQAEQRIFDQQTSGLLGLDGKPIGTTKVTWGPIPGVVWGIAILFMDENTVGFMHLEGPDCQQARAQIGPDTEPVTFMRLRVPPPQQQYGTPWSGAPGSLAELMVGRAQHLAQLWALNAMAAEGLDPANLPDGWTPPSDVQAAIDAVMAISVPDIPLPPGAVDGQLFEQLLTELERTRNDVAAYLDACQEPGYSIDGEVLEAITAAVWPNGRENYPTSARDTDG